METPYLFNLLRDIPDGDVVIYCDAGASINFNEKLQRDIFSISLCLKIRIFLI